MTGHSPDMSKSLTPAQVSKMAKCGRSSVMRALASRELPGIRDNSNRWKISAEDAQKWAGQRPNTDRTITESDRKETGHTATDTHQNPTQSALMDAIAEAAGQRARANALAEQVNDLQKERDKLMDIIQKQSETRSSGIIARLFGR